MIKSFVKQFIEDYITEIEQHDWFRVCERWYDLALFQSLDYDETMFEQFVAIMQHVVGVDFLKESRKARQDVIHFHLNEIVQDHITDRFAPNRGQYKKRLYTDQLVTFLRFTEKEVIEICDSVVSDLGLKYDEIYYYIGEKE